MPDIVIVFFLLGLVAGLLKSDLRVPSAVYETLSILLMLALGLKGGMALHGRAEWGMLYQLLPIASLGVLIPLLIYPILRRLVQLSTENAVSIAAHYGSVSAGTFAVALALIAQSQLPIAPETTLYLVLLELPALIVMLLWHQRLGNQTQSTFAVVHEALTSRSVLLLTGGIIIGWLYGPVGLEPITPALIGGFKTFLALFLLEMGICTARACVPLPVHQWRLLIFAAAAPFGLAWLGIATGLALNLPAGSILALAALTASASYIAAPVAIRAAVPKADIGLAMLASLGVTFPINVIIGLPLYQSWIQSML
ncbi:sodium-dependent bicarbonate transport family permease [Gilvimarinus algae]|uniref:Sodium-dependent bicarbonate transport family permease n=1 Tax=Gilvimarinus algae TaxID=3058037 RepID=A0ABT8THF6_9GAMM|nr:sodium-dependent bicarbonate transport family permease [Gilvimarinus sp. SDUM040014]MDO3383020.1 sodium-dependent bicarbonate transport family permease [Gilvimarinus sp. SDUM040014]